MKKSMFSIFEEIEKNKDIIESNKKNQKTKKSLFNVFQKIDGNKNIIFNSFSLAIAMIDDDFFRLYNKVENIDYYNLNEKDKKSYDRMIQCNFIVKEEINEIDNLENFIYQRISNYNILNLSIFLSNKNKEIKNNIISNNDLDKIFQLIKYRAEKKTPILIKWHCKEPLSDYEIFYNFSQKAINICREYNVKYFSEIITDGYSLTDNVIDKLKDCNISLLHTTMDLPPQIPDKDTFKIFLENITKSKKNNISINIKINIKKDFNIDSLLKLIEILEENGLKDRYYFNVSEFDSNSNKDLYSSNKNCFTNSGYAEFCLSFYKKLQKSNINNLKNTIYPNINRLNYCDVTKCRSLNIGPDGSLYNCSIQAELSENKTGNINDIKNLNDIYIDNDYITWKPFKFTECNKCYLIPICYGNCPKIKINHSNESECNEKKNIINNLIKAIGLEKTKAKK